METSQDSFQFPSVQLQDAVNKLWDKLHEVNGTMNFLIERNVELKRKLDSGGTLPDSDNSSTQDYQNKIDGLELEINDYLNHIYSLETKIHELSEQNDQLQLLQLNYHRIISSYDKIKKYLKLGSSSPLPVIIKESDSKKIAALEETIAFLRDEIAQKNIQITKSTEELLRLNNLITELKEEHSDDTDSQIKTDFLNDKIDELINSRELLAEESDNLRVQIERLQQEHKSEISTLQEKIKGLEVEKAELSGIRAKLINEMENINSDISLRENQLVNETAELMEQIDLLNEQLANADMIIKSSAKKDDEISELSLKLQELTDTSVEKEQQLNLSISKSDEQQSTIKSLNHRIEELNSEIANLNAELMAKKDVHSSEIQAELEVKDMMIKDFAKNEKELVGKIQEMELELVNKDKIITDNRNADVILEGRLIQLENKIKEQENIIAGSLINNDNNLDYELKQARKEIDIKTNTITTLRQQLQKLQTKLDDLETSLIKTDSRISLDEAIRADLINNLESQLIKLEMLIGK